jgi:hypothetical protein
MISMDKTNRRCEKTFVGKNRQALKFFDHRQVRTIWSEQEEKWYFSVVDIIAVLVEKDYQDARKYWNKLAQRLRDEGAEQSVTNCHRLKLEAADGKRYLSDVADTETILRIIQSIPSKKAEPFKAWLARVGRERIDEIADPELAIDRALKTYERKGYSKEWIGLRLKSIDVRKDLTTEWEERGIDQEKDYAILTDDISKAWAGMSSREYKNFKGLKRESLRDNMSNVELVLNMLAEVSTTEISKTKQPKTFQENRKIAREGGAVAAKARQELETQTGQSAITSMNAKELHPGVAAKKQLLKEADDDSLSLPGESLTS